MTYEAVNQALIKQGNIYARLAAETSGKLSIDRKHIASTCTLVGNAIKRKHGMFKKGVAVDRTLRGRIIDVSVATRYQYRFTNYETPSFNNL